jgi:hypothetical protein
MRCSRPNARGDLGLEMPLEHVPRAQRDIILCARQHGIPVILATQVLESKTHAAGPTRVEVSDAANGVTTASTPSCCRPKTASVRHRVAHPRTRPNPRAHSQALTCRDLIHRAQSVSDPAARSASDDDKPYPPLATTNEQSRLIRFQRKRATRALPPAAH